ncbi:MAG: DUF1285 domain-containing protein [bacterium]
MSKLNLLFDQLKTFDRPPVDCWHPEKTVEFDLQITANGEWIHEGKIISRHRLVKLFSTVLVLRGDRFYLVTPQVKYHIQVDEAPFMAVELRIQGNGSNQDIYFRTNMDEVVKADAKHPFTMDTDPENGQPRPYIEIRNGLCAKLTRSVYYELAELSMQSNRINGELGVISGGVFFKMA